MRISDWSSDVCSSDLGGGGRDDAIAPHDLDAALCQRRTGECAVGLEQGPCLQGPSRSLERVAGRHRLLIERPEALVPGGERPAVVGGLGGVARSEEHTSELQSLMRISYAVFCLKKKTHEHKPKTKLYKMTIERMITREKEQTHIF